MDQLTGQLQLANAQQLLEVRRYSASYGTCDLLFSLTRKWCDTRRWEFEPLDTERFLLLPPIYLERQMLPKVHHEAFHRNHILGDSPSILLFVVCHKHLNNLLAVLGLLK